MAMHVRRRYCCSPALLAASAGAFVIAALVGPAWGEGVEGGPRYAVRSLEEAFEATRVVPGVAANSSTGVALQAGLYAPNATVAGSNHSVVSVQIGENSAFRVQGEGVDNTIIDLQGKLRLLTVIGLGPNARVYISNLTITNGGFSDPAYLRQQNQMLEYSAAQQSNSSASNEQSTRLPATGAEYPLGGALYLSAVYLTLHNAAINNCSAFVGGAIYYSAAPSSQPHIDSFISLEIVETSFSYNSAIAGAGLVMIQDSEWSPASKCSVRLSFVSVTDAIISSNQSWAIQDNSTFYAPGSRALGFGPNESQYGGIGIHLLSSQGKELNIDVGNSRFVNCGARESYDDAEKGGLRGGAITLLSKTQFLKTNISISSSVFEVNSGGIAGGGIFFTMGDSSADTNATSKRPEMHLRDCNFVDTLSQQFDMGMGPQVYISGIVSFFQTCSFFGKMLYDTTYFMGNSHFLSTDSDVHFDRPSFEVLIEDDSPVNRGCDIQLRKSVTLYTCPSNAFDKIEVFLCDGIPTFVGNDHCQSNSKHHAGVSSPYFIVGLTLCGLIVLAIAFAIYSRCRCSARSTTAKLDVNHARADLAYFPISNGSADIEDGECCTGSITDISWSRFVSIVAKQRGINVFPSADLKFGKTIARRGSKKIISAQLQGFPVVVALPQCLSGRNVSYAVENLINEILMLCNCHHPSIIGIRGVLEDRPGFITTQVSGGNLLEFRRQHSRGDELSKLLFLAKEIAFGLKYMHTQGIIHCGICSSNILVEVRNNWPHATIVGFAQSISGSRDHSAAPTQALRKTAPYCAPEMHMVQGSGSDATGKSQFRAELISSKIDVFSFGILLCELWSGREVRTGSQKSGQLTSDTLEMLLEPAIADIPVKSCPWRELARKCLAHDAEERPSMDTVCSELMKIIDARSR